MGTGGASDRSATGNFARGQIGKILAFWFSEQIAHRQEKEFRLLIQLHGCRGLFFPFCCSSVILMHIVHG